MMTPRTHFPIGRHCTTRILSPARCAAAVCLLLPLVGDSAAAQGATANPAKEIVVSTDQILNDSAGRLAEMRKHLRTYWAPIEVGGIFLVPGTDDDENDAFFRALAARVPLTAGVPDHRQLSKRLDILADDVAAFLSAAKLTPGPYRIDNYHLELAEDGKLPYSFSFDEPPIELPLERTFLFTVTEEHLKLLRHLNTGARDDPPLIELMDVKRPYGYMTYHFLDMAEALGEPEPRDADFTPQQIERYSRLHREMLFAAQAFWIYAQ